MLIHTLCKWMNFTSTPQRIWNKAICKLGIYPMLLCLNLFSVCLQAVWKFPQQANLHKLSAHLETPKQQRSITNYNWMQSSSNCIFTKNATSDNKNRFYAVWERKSCFTCILDLKFGSQGWVNRRKDSLVARLILKLDLVRRLTERVSRAWWTVGQPKGLTKLWIKFRNWLDKTCWLVGFPHVLIKIVNNMR